MTSVPDDRRISELADLIYKTAEIDMTLALRSDAQCAQLIAFGEIHGQPNPFQKICIELMPDLKSLGFSTMAIEITDQLSGDFVAFNNKQAGKDEALATLIAAKQGRNSVQNELPQSARQRDTNFFQMLLEARELGIELIPVDPYALGITDIHREQLLTEAVAKVLKAKGRVIYWGGARHVHKRITINTDCQSMAEGISKHLGGQGVHSIAGIVKCEDKYANLQSALAKLPKRVYLKTSKLPVIAKMPAFTFTCRTNEENSNNGCCSSSPPFDLCYGGWDALILVP